MGQLISQSAGLPHSAAIQQQAAQSEADDQPGGANTSTSTAALSYLLPPPRANSNAAFWQLEKDTKALPKVYLEQFVLKPGSTDGNSLYARSKRSRLPKTAINSAHGRELRGLQELEAGNLTDLEQLLSHKKMQNACEALAKSLAELELDTRSRRQAQKDLASLQDKLGYLRAQAYIRISTASDWVLLHRQRVEATSQGPEAAPTETALRDLNGRLAKYVVNHDVGLSSDSWLDIGTPTI
ncbi:hypothetical protein CBOM_00075 [Ceraceosorus bombacis]|uniref:Uncharacterized protein n=1 Tax=Ceraceosorus bombacis TaxID=401625 RepID=A0A0P1B945_9BASI|nr:hypothetical protein CBOM_00075 [Ceraceosorus bombacis]